MKTNPHVDRLVDEINGQMARNLLDELGITPNTEPNEIERLVRRSMLRDIAMELVRQLPDDDTNRAT